MTEPTTAAGRALLGVAYLAGDATSEGVNLLEAILDIEAEARQQDGSALRTALKLIASADTKEGDKAHDATLVARDALAALPPSAPPALDVERLAKVIALVDMADTDEEARAYAEDIAAEYARLDEGSATPDQPNT